LRLRCDRRDLKSHDRMLDDRRAGKRFVFLSAVGRGTMPEGLPCRGPARSNSRFRDNAPSVAVGTYCLHGQKRIKKRKERGKGKERNRTFGARCRRARDYRPPKRRSMPIRGVARETIFSGQAQCAQKHKLLSVIHEPNDEYFGGTIYFVLTGKLGWS